MRPALLLILAVALATGGGVRAQEPERTQQIIDLDRGSLLAAKPLPFRERFRLKVPMLKDTNSAEAVWGWVQWEGGHLQEHWLQQTPVSLKPKNGAEYVILDMEELPPNQQYFFRVRYFAQEDTGYTSGKAKVAGTSRFTGSTDATFASHFDADVGVIHAINSGYTGISTAAHIYGTPINKRSREGGWAPWQQVSLMVGFAVAELNSDEPVKKRFAAGNPLIGLGWKPIQIVAPGSLLDDLRITGGLMFFQQADANPLVDVGRNKKDWFLGVTVDLAYRDVLAPLLRGFIG